MRATLRLTQQIIGREKKVDNLQRIISLLRVTNAIQITSFCLWAKSSRLLVLLMLSSAVIVVPSAHADEAAQHLYSNFNSAIYRIDVVTLGSEKKASLGTGFVIGRDDILASNFHVVASVVHEPERYKLEWQSVDGRRGGGLDARPIHR